MTDRVTRYEHPNRTFWDDDADDYQAAHHADIADPAWGAYRIPESELSLLTGGREKKSGNLLNKAL